MPLRLCGCGAQVLELCSFNACYTCCANLHRVSGHRHPYVTSSNDVTLPVRWPVDPKTPDDSQPIPQRLEAEAVLCTTPWPASTIGHVLNKSRGLVGFTFDAADYCGF